MNQCVTSHTFDLIFSTYVMKFSNFTLLRLPINVLFSLVFGVELGIINERKRCGRIDIFEY